MAADLGGGAWQRHDGDAEMPGSAHAGTTPKVRTHRVDMGPAYPARAPEVAPQRVVTDRFYVAKKFNEVVDSLRKNITREYKAKLTKDQRKVFRSQMWAFRRDPESLSAEEKQALEALFEKILVLRPLYKVRLRFKEIFEQARRITAALVEGTSP